MKIWQNNINTGAFNKMKDSLLKKYYGKTAVFCDGKLISIGKNIKDAVRKAKVSKEKEIFVRELFRPEEQTQAIL